jgi:hypothetical protein
MPKWVDVELCLKRVDVEIYLKGWL